MSSTPDLSRYDMEAPRGPSHPLVRGRFDRLLVAVVVLEVGLVAVLAALVWHSAHAGGIDREVASELYGAPGSAPRSVFSAITLLGLPAVAIAAACAVAGWTWFRFRDWKLAAFCPVAVACAAVAKSVLKKVVDRARPPTAALAHVHGQSFPSGHATAAAALALAVGLLLVGVVVRQRLLAGIVAAVYVVAISVSRIVLGVHFLTDVIAGVAVGTVTVLVMARLWSALGRRTAARGPVR